MRHTEALICVVALLAKQPGSNTAHLLAHERMSISETYMATPRQTLFTVAASRLNPPRSFALRSAFGP